MTYPCRIIVLLASAILNLAPTAGAASLVVTTNQLGSTPEILAYNSGHFYFGSNTRDWWRYSGVNGVRFFILTTGFEPTNYRHASVSNWVSFLFQRDALRID